MTKKKLSLAFIWHMHQPIYKEFDNRYALMPWVRMHAIKDYLDMLVIIDKFKNIKLNFSISPVLIDAIESYTDEETHDLHSLLTLSDVKDFKEEDKVFILNNFFSANYTNMILHHQPYADLYTRRYASENIKTEDFSNQDYSDIMAWFNLAWFDPIWKNYYPELMELAKKGKNFTLDDRKKIISIQREIIKQIIPTYKKYQEEGKIEILVSPYYHPILPLLTDEKYLNNTDLKKDAFAQIKLAVEKYKKVFSCEPKGIWVPEHAISSKTIDLLAKFNFKYTISDEGILSKSIDKEFVRDFKGNLEDPYELTNIYSYKSPKTENKINLIFRDSVLPSLINFEYSQHDQIIAANDLYERIKNVQSKLEPAPDQSSLLTIALDGENCWEGYRDDGSQFLYTIYSLIEENDKLQTVLVSDYIDNVKSKHQLPKVYAGSWINRNFKLWIDEPTKDLAWEYLIKTRNDLIKFAKKSDDEKLIKKAWNEIYIAESSDWFWWYGQPNDSGQDEIFDYLFREHLINVYSFFRKPIPKYLNLPLDSHIGKPSRVPKSSITPYINGEISAEDTWENAGCIDILDGPVLQSNKIFDKICFGCDKNNLYFRFDVNDVLLDKNYQPQLDYKNYFQAYIYFKNEKDSPFIGSNIRTSSKIDNIYPILADKYTHEVRMLFYMGKFLPIDLSQSTKEGLWVLKFSHKIKYAFEKVLELAIPFDELNVSHGEKVEFFIINGTLGYTHDFIPKDLRLDVTRP